MFNHARKHRIVTENPASGVSDLYRQAKTVHEEIQPMNANEVSVFLAAAKQTLRDVLPAVPLRRPYWLRSAELAGLQWGDVDFSGKYLIVRRSVVRGRIEKTKTSKTRRLDMSDALIQELEALKRSRKAEYLAAGKNEIPDWVFLGPGRIIWEDGKPSGREEGQRVDMYNVKNRYFHKCFEKAKLRRIRLHDLRHTFASLLI
jgi:integrase